MLCACLFNFLIFLFIILDIYYIKMFIALLFYINELLYV